MFVQCYELKKQILLSNLFYTQHITLHILYRFATYLGNNMNNDAFNATKLINTN